MTLMIFLNNKHSVWRKFFLYIDIDMQFWTIGQFLVFFNFMLTVHTFYLTVAHITLTV